MERQDLRNNLCGRAIPFDRPEQMTASGHHVHRIDRQLGSELGSAQDRERPRGANASVACLMTEANPVVSSAKSTPTPVMAFKAVTTSSAVGSIACVAPNCKRHRPACCDRIDGNDDPGPGGTRSKHSALPHRSGSEYYEGCGRPDPKGVPHRPGTGLDTAAQRAEALKLGVVGHLDHVALVSEREGRERGLAEEVAVNRRALL